MAGTGTLITCSWVLFFIKKSPLPQNPLPVTVYFGIYKIPAEVGSLHPPPWNFPVAAAKADGPFLRL